MRGANAYEALNQTHEQVAGELQPMPSPNGPSQSDIDRALALEDESSTTSTPQQEAPSLDGYVAPEEWTSRGGMVEQQASAMDWLEHSNEVRQERAAEQAYDAAAHELTADDRELLDAARSTEAQAQQQDLGQTHYQEPDGP